MNIFLACPVYSEANITLNHVTSIVNALSSPHNVRYCTYATSALPLCFNILWSEALNTRPWDYFVFLHSDVGCEYRWLSDLIEQLKDNDLDALSAVVAIKNDSCETSTAIYDSNGKWKRLRWDEIYGLPKVFTQQDLDTRGVGGKLLINTGVFICRFDQPWVEERVWRFQDAIHRDGEKYSAWMMPEDWEFSLWANARGLKIGATSAVKVQHLGLKQYHG